MKSIIKAAKLLFTNPAKLFTVLLCEFGFFIPDSLYLRMLFRLKMGRWPNLKCPKTYNEKLQWLKLYNRDPFYTSLVDKVSVKDFVKNAIGEEYIIPTLGVWNDARNINFDLLPSQFVLKTTNGGGGDVVICRDKSKFDSVNAVKHLKKGLRKSIYNEFREWPYKNVSPRIIAEKYMEDGSGELKDFKFFCFDGDVKCIQVDYDRYTEHHRNMYDADWNQLPFTIMYPSKEGVVIERPQNLDKMLEISRILSKGFPHVRVDLYNVSGKIFFGELTFYHASGMKKFTPENWDLRFGNWLKLPFENEEFGKK